MGPISRKKNSPLRKAIFQIYQYKCWIKEEIVQNIEKDLFEIFFKNNMPIQKNTWLTVNFKNHCNLVYGIVYIWKYIRTPPGEIHAMLFEEKTGKLEH